MTENKRFYMDKSGDLYDRENETVMIDFGYSYDGVGCKRIIDLLNGLAEENQALKERRHEDINELAVIAIKYNALKEENKELRILINTLKEQNQKFKARLNDLGVEYL